MLYFKAYKGFGIPKNLKIVMKYPIYQTTTLHQEQLN